MKKEQVEILEQLLNSYHIDKQIFIEYGCSFEKLIPQLSNNNNQEIYNEPNLQNTHENKDSNYEEYLNYSNKELQEAKDKLIEQKVSLLSFVRGDKSRTYSEKIIQEKQKELEECKNKIIFISKLIEKTKTSNQDIPYMLTNDKTNEQYQNQIKDITASYETTIKELEKSISLHQKK